MVRGIRAHAHRGARTTPPGGEKSRREACFLFKWWEEIGRRTAPSLTGQLKSDPLTTDLGVGECKLLLSASLRASFSRSCRCWPNSYFSTTSSRKPSPLRL